MKYDIVLAGVGGQGVLSLSSVIAQAAMKKGLSVKQSEVHGMAQRGGAVVSNLRISDEEIASDLIPKGTAKMLLSMEPLECFRYLDYLSPNEGTVVTSTDPVLNIPDYPDMNQLLDSFKSLPKSILVDAKELAKKAGSTKTTNTVILGAASRLLPIESDVFRDILVSAFERKGFELVEINLKAYDLGREIGQ